MSFYCVKQKRALKNLGFFYLSRDHARIAIALFCFLCRVYNVSDQDMANVEDFLARNRTNLRKLHERFYKEFELGLCNKYIRSTKNNIITKEPLNFLSQKQTQAHA